MILSNLTSINYQLSLCCFGCLSVIIHTHDIPGSSSSLILYHRWNIFSFSLSLIHDACFFVASYHRKRASPIEDTLCQAIILLQNTLNSQLINPLNKHARQVGHPFHVIYVGAFHFQFRTR